MALIPLLLAGLACAAPASSTAPKHEDPWRARLDQAAATRDDLSARLQAALAVLRPRAVAERPDLLPKLDQAAPKPAPSGWGLIPPVGPDDPEASADVAPAERRFDLPTVLSWESGEERAVAALAARLEKGEKPLGPLVDEYLLRRENFNRIDGHVRYHASWQPEARRSAGFFAGRNELLAAFRLWRSTSAAQAARDVARRKLEDEIVQFSKAPRLRIEGPPPLAVLRVPVQTDIEDAAFLKHVQDGVERTWNRSAAMKGAGVRIEISWIYRDPKALYPEGPPVKGAAIDLSRHLDRFGPGELVLTTGASSTQAYPARGVLLGATPISERALAHEFSHLLGFSDGYLRAFDGSPDDPDGVIFWEITPFPGDLLADPGAGRVTAAIARRLLENYGAPPAAVGTTGPR